MFNNGVYWCAFDLNPYIWEGMGWVDFLWRWIMGCGSYWCYLMVWCSVLGEEGVGHGCVHWLWHCVWQNNCEAKCRALFIIFVGLL
jgi:hypothetical protein